MTYEEFQERYPQLFANPDGCPIQIVTDGVDRVALEAAIRERNVRAGLPPDWARVGILHFDQYLILLRDAVLFADGNPGTYLRIYEQPPGTAGVAILPRLDDAFVLLRHFRHATRAYHIEIPRGFAVAGVSPEDNARKEIAEEIGATCRSLLPLGELDANTGLSGTRTHLFFATIDRVGEPERAEGVMEILTVSVEGLETMIAQGQITDSFTIACYTRAKLTGVV
jgi:ADP-ribose pyrophosphatase